MGYKRASEKSSTERSISCRGSCSRIVRSLQHNLFMDAQEKEPFYCYSLQEFGKKLNKGEQGGKTGYKDFSTDILIRKILSTAIVWEGLMVLPWKSCSTRRNRIIQTFTTSMKRVPPEKMLDPRRNKTGFLQERKLFSSFV